LGQSNNVEKSTGEGGGGGGALSKLFNSKKSYLRLRILAKKGILKNQIDIIRYGEDFFLSVRKSGDGNKRRGLGGGDGGG